MEYIKPNSLPWEYAQNAYNDGHYIEASQILHGYLENKLQELLMMVGSGNFNTNFKDTWDVVNQIPFIHTLKALFVIGRINKAEYNSLLKLNKMRNKIMHQLFLEPYEKDNPGIPKRDFDDVFKKSLKAVHLIEEKIHMNC
jgi:hypothetical protein